MHSHGLLNLPAYNLFTLLSNTTKDHPGCVLLYQLANSIACSLSVTIKDHLGWVSPKSKQSRKCATSLSTCNMMEVFYQLKFLIPFDYFKLLKIT